MNKIPVLNDNSIYDFLKDAKGLVLLEVYSKDSGISLIISPLLNRLCNIFNSELSHYRLNKQKSNNFLLKYQLVESSTLMLFKKTVLLEIINGLAPYIELENIITKHLQNEESSIFKR